MLSSVLSRLCLNAVGGSNCSACTLCASSMCMCCGTIHQIHCRILKAQPLRVYTSLRWSAYISSVEIRVHLECCLTQPSSRATKPDLAVQAMELLAMQLWWQHDVTTLITQQSPCNIATTSCTASCWLLHRCLDAKRQLTVWCCGHLAQLTGCNSHDSFVSH